MFKGYAIDEKKKGFKNKTKYLLEPSSFEGLEKNNCLHFLCSCLSFHGLFIHFVYDLLKFFYHCMNYLCTCILSFLDNSGNFLLFLTTCDYYPFFEGFFTLKILVYLVNIVVYNLIDHNFKIVIYDVNELKTKTMDKKIKHKQHM